MTKNKYLLHSLAVAIVTAFFSLFQSCGNGNKADNGANTTMTDTVGSDSAMHNPQVEMPADNTISKDSASNREDLGGGSE